MKFLNGQHYVEVKDRRYRNHPTENNILQKRDPPTSLRTQYQVQNETQIGRNQKVVENNGKLEVKSYLKIKQPIQQQPKYKPTICPTCKQSFWLDIYRGCF